MPESYESVLGRASALLDDIGRRDGARVVSTALAAAQAKRSVRVAIVGELSQGKSTLVNALVGLPGLITSPDGQRTWATVEVEHDQELSAEISSPDMRDAEPLTIEEVATYASRPPQGTRGLERIRIRAPSFRLRELVLIDTPGLGRSIAPADELAMAEARDADALLLVSDAHRGLIGSELEFLEIASERTTSLAVVVTKIDEVSAWATVVDEDRGKVARLRSRDGLLTPLSIPVFPVRAGNLEDVLFTARDDDAVNAMRSASGMADVIEYLGTNVRNRSQGLRAARALLIAQTELDDARAIEAQREEALKNDHEPDRQIEQTKDKRNGLIVAADEASQRINAEWPTLSRDLPQLLRDRLDELKTTFVERARTARTAELPDVQSEYQQALAGVFNAVCDEADKQIRELGSELFAQMDEGSRFEQHFEAEDEIRKIPELRGGYTKADLLGGLSGMGIANMTTAATLGILGVAAGALATVVALPVAVVIGGVIVKIRKEEADRTRLESWIATQSAQAESSMSAALRDALINARTQLEAALTTLGKARAEKLDAQIEALTDDMESGAAEQDTKKREIKKRKNDLDETMVSVRTVMDVMLGRR